MQTTRQPFVAKGDFVAGLHGIRFSGRSYAPGDEFPWRKLPCSPRRLQQLYDRRLIEYVGGFDPDKARADVESIPVEEVGPKTFIFDPELHEIRDEQVVDREGNTLLDVDKKLAKKLGRTKKPVEIELDEE